MQRALAAIALVLLPLGAIAEDAPAPVQAPVQDWSNTIETVVVRADQQGPLLWHVRKGNSEIYLIAVVVPVPQKLAWSDAGVKAALAGARQLLLPPGASVGLFEGLWFLMWNRDAIYLPSDTPMESTLPEVLRNRFVAVRNRLHQDADRYSDLRVPLAGLRLDGDFLKASNLSFKEPSDTIESLARRAHVPSKRVASYEALPLLKQLPSMSNAANQTCMKAALDDIEAQGAHAASAADAWATGDLEGMKANYSETRFESCVQSMPSFAALFERAVKDSVTAVNGALAKPGKAVMVLSLGSLLRQNGVLDRLKAEGLTIDPPAQGVASPG